MRAVVAVLTLLTSFTAAAQVFVYPRRPLKSQVRYYDFEWQHVDILVGPEADTSKAEALDRRVTPPLSPSPVPTDNPHVPPSSEAPAAPEGPVEPRGEAAGSPLDLPGQARGTGGVDGGIPGEPSPGETADGGMVTLAPDAGVPGLVSAPPLPEVPPPDAGSVTAEERGTLADAPFVERRLPPGADPAKLLGARTGGVRLFFYEREREVAERAAAIIVDAYVYLVGQFDYVPTQTFPYILYSSYQEFLQTNLFPLQEGTLGVTSPVDLKLTLPYFGDHQLFAEVSAHEMAHQFTIQKVRTATEQAQIWGDPLQAIPLWFIEGLAEYYAKHGVDPEADMLVRDLVINPDFELGYTLLGFFEDRPWSFLWTYKMGQVRCAFLEETYGRGTIQRILAESPRLVGEVRGLPAFDDFKTLLHRVTGDEPKQIEAKFEAWLKARAYRTYLASGQSTPALERLELDELYIDSLQASPSGNLLLYRSIDPDTGRSRLKLIDRRAPSQAVLIAVDGVPGVESLHPVWGRNFALTDRQLAFVAEDGGSDVVYWQPIEHEVRALVQKEVTRAREASAEPGETTPLNARKVELWDVSLDVGKRRAFDIGRKGLIAAYAPAFSPDGSRLAFVGFDSDGTRDIYLLTPDDAAEHGFTLTRLTDDVYAERQIAWGPDGIVFNSDATGHGRYNLFRVRPDAPGQVERLTTEERDHLDPTVLPDGRIFFTAYDRGRADVHEVRDGEVIRRTEITTGLFDLSPGPHGAIWALYHKGGRRTPVIVPPRQLLSAEVLPQPAPDEPRAIAQRPLEGAVPYERFALRNWELGPPFGFIGGGTGGIWGQVVASASDKLRNHALLLNVAVLGSFELTDGYLVYLNQERRLTWGAGPFQSLVFRIDETLEEFTLSSPLISTERFYGVLGSLRYPFNQFVYVQGDLAVGGVSYFLLRSEREFIEDPVVNGTGVNLLPLWRERNEGARFQTEATLRFGYDTIRYSIGGPIAGSSFMIEASTAYQPFEPEVFGTLRLDGERYFPIYGRTHFFLRAGAGTTFGGRLARQFALSTFDTIRGIPYGNTHFSIGRHFFFSTAELQVPLNAIIRVLILTDIEAIAGIDFGGVGRELGGIWDRRVLSPVVGVNFGLGPLVLRLHFAKPLDIGAPQGLPSPGGEWVTNFSIRILGYEGLFDRRHDRTSDLHVPRPALLPGSHPGF